MALARCAFKVEGLDCPVEANILRSTLETVDGIESIGFDLLLGTMTVAYDPDRASPASIVSRVASDAKMKADLLTEPAAAQGRNRWLVPAASGSALLAATLVDNLTPYSWLAWMLRLVAVVFGGAELFPKALTGVRRLRADIHVLMALAILGAVGVGEWSEAATIAFLFALSEAVESYSLSRARKAVQSLVESSPRDAELIDTDGASRRVDAASLRLGDRVRVRPGEVVPVDGIVLAGASSVDFKSTTGESLPVSREPGDSVGAGGVNGEGTLEVEATADAGDSVAARISRRVREAQARRAPIEKSVERFAAWYTPTVLGIALALMVLPPLILHLRSADPNWRDWFNRGLVVLVASCPCALVVSTPVAFAAAVAAAGRRGILLRGGPFLEEFGRLKAIAFDKTGTLTRGEPSVIDVVDRVRADFRPSLLQIAAALGDQGGHLLGKAITRHAREREVEIPSAVAYKAIPGFGATGTVDSVEYFMGSHRYLDREGLCRPDFHRVLDDAERAYGTAVALSAQDGPLGWIRLADDVRPEAAETVARLKAQGLWTAMLTGDNEKAAATIAARLGVDETHAALLPDDKAGLVADLIKAKGSTGMVGDGVNDAPALATARVSVVLGDTASGMAMEAADVVLMSRNLWDLPWLVDHGRATIRRVRQNIALALGTKAVVVVVAATGLVVGPAALWLAVAADVGTTVLVTVNALRLLRT